MTTRNNTVFTGKVLIRLREVDSTNTWIRDNREGIPADHGLVVIADHQTGGRGRQQKKWVSAPGLNLTFSVRYLPRSLMPADLVSYNMAVALAVHDTVSDLLPAEKVEVKWPNDIYLNGKKVAGILIESGLRDNRIDQLVTGIGLNVNQTDFPGLPDAVSMQQVAGSSFVPEEVLETLLVALEQAYLLVESGRNRTGILNRYNEHLYRRGELQEFLAGERTVRAYIDGVDANGHLVLRERGEKKSFAMGELVWIK